MVMDSDGVPLVSPHACSEASSTVLCPPSFSPSLPRPSLFPSPPPNPPVPLSNKGSRLECVSRFFSVIFLSGMRWLIIALYFDGTTTSSFLATLCPAPRFPPQPTQPPHTPTGRCTLSLCTPSSLEITRDCTRIHTDPSHQPAFFRPEYLPPFPASTSTFVLQASSLLPISYPTIGSDIAVASARVSLL